MASEAPDITEKTAEPVSSGSVPPNSQPAPTTEEVNPVAIAPERLPTRKDVPLRELLNKIDDYAPIVSAERVFTRSALRHTNSTIY
jgi:transcription initiation factor TFIID subunit 10